MGIDTYPGSTSPGPAAGLPPIEDFGDAFLEGIAQLRECWMPKAGFGRARRSASRRPATPPARAAREAPRPSRAALARTAVPYRGTYDVTHFNWFGLRDNNSHGPNFQSYFGLLHDDYSPKARVRGLPQAIARYGA